MSREWGAEQGRRRDGVDDIEGIIVIEGNNLEKQRRGETGLKRYGSCGLEVLGTRQRGC
jgi:hypothetical protein